MNSDRGTGAAPGPQDNANPNVQSDQPSSQNVLNLDQPTKPGLESLYQLPEETRVAIMALPPELRDPAVAALNQARGQFETGVHDKLEEGRQAIANMNALYADPRFQDFLTGATHQQVAPQPNPPATQPSIGNALYETSEQAQQASAIIEDMSKRIGESLNITELSAAVQNIQRGMAQNSQQRDWDALKEYTKENNLPDPDTMKSKIALMIRDNPGLTLDQAYTANVDLRSLATRPSITDTGDDDPNAGNNDNLPASLQMPGTSKSSAVPDTKTEVTDPIEAAYANRAEGKVVDGEQGFKDAYADAINNYNAEHGTTFEPDDFQV